MCKTSRGITYLGNRRNGCRFGCLSEVEVLLYLLGIRITPEGVDELLLTTIEVKNQQNQLNQQETRVSGLNTTVEGERSLWRV